MSKFSKSWVQKTENTSGWQPANYTVLVDCEKIEEMTDGGIVIPEVTLEKDQIAQVRAVIIAFGSQAFKEGTTWSKGESEILRTVGLEVFIARNSGIFLDHKSMADSKNTYRIINDKDVLAYRMKI